MPNNGLEVFDTTMQKTHMWLNALSKELQIVDRHEAYRVMRAVLHALRDQLGADEAAQLSAQMPMLVRGIFFEGWHPSDTAPVHTVEEFEKRIYRNHGARPHVNALDMIDGVASVLRKYIEPGEIDQVLGRLPQPIRESMTGRTAMARGAI